jgi:hypothetical protein
MFVKAIETVAKFVRPIHTITRNYNTTNVHPVSASLFFVNEEGWALTCKHVTDLVTNADKVNRRYRQFSREAHDLIVRKRKTAVKDLEKKYGYSERITVEIRNNFVNCMDGKLDVKIVPHPKLDLALIKFSSGKLQCENFPTFPSRSDDLKPGRMFCRLGYPFPDFTNYRFNDEKDSIEWTDEGRLDTPLFPMEGMVTRLVLQSGNGEGANGGGISGFEMSTPGLRGQSGGPVFDADGKVWGVQFATGHLYLGFDIHEEVFKLGKSVTVTDNAFLHVGRCIHVDPIKEFLKANQVAFRES